MTEKNKSFFLGLAVGVAVIAVAGWIISATGGNNKVSSNNEGNKLEKNSQQAEKNNSGGAVSLAVGKSEIRLIACFAIDKLRITVAALSLTILK